MAFKLLRPEHVSQDGEPKWEFRAFPNEADLLMKVAGNPHVVQLLDCGYISAAGEAPIDGEIKSFHIDAMGFAQAMQEYAESGWRPYLPAFLKPAPFEQSAVSDEAQPTGRAVASAQRRRPGAGVAVRRTA